jgi:hypothetical protein
VGELGPDPIESEMFDKDGHGMIQVALLPHETLYIPFTFMTLIPSSHHSFMKPLQSTRSYDSNRNNERNRKKFHEDEKFSERNEMKSNLNNKKQLNDETASRTIEVRMISASHGHIIAVLRINIYPRPTIIQRYFHFYEIENTIMKRRLQLLDHSHTKEQFHFPQTDVSSSGKFIHCVELDMPTNTRDAQGSLYLYYLSNVNHYVSIINSNGCLNYNPFTLFIHY